MAEGAGNTGRADVIVVGAGHNGLTTACYLARAGLDVLVLEAAPGIGGMSTTAAMVDGAPEHLFNVCAMDMFFIRPSPMPRELDLARYGYREVDLDPQTVYLDEDGSSLAFWQDPAKTAAELAYYSRKDAAAFLALAEKLEAYCDFVTPFTLVNPMRPGWDAIRQVLGAAGRHRLKALGLARLMASSMAEVIEEVFEHQSVRTLLAHGSWGGPILERGSGIYLLYWGWYHRWGSGRAVGGTGTLPVALQRCLTEAGGRVRTSAHVERLTLSGGAITGVRLTTGEEIRAATVVAGCDAKQTLARLLPEGTLPGRLERRAGKIPTEGTSALKIDVALHGRIELSKHTAGRRDDLDLRKPYVFRGTFDEQIAAVHAAKRNLLPDVVPYIATLSSGADPTQAPQGQDVLSIWASRLPFAPDEPWNVVGERATKQIMANR